MSPEQIEQLRKIGIEHLIYLFGEYSEDRWCASWHIATEIDLWKDATSEKPTAMAKRIMEIADILGVWIHWPDEADGPVPIPLDEWKRKVGAA